MVHRCLHKKVHEGREFLFFFIRNPLIYFEGFGACGRLRGTSHDGVRETEGGLKWRSFNYRITDVANLYRT
jgi:hypothetical protein